MKWLRSSWDLECVSWLPLYYPLLVVVYLKQCGSSEGLVFLWMLSSEDEQNTFHLLFLSLGWLQRSSHQPAAACWCIHYTTEQHEFHSRVL